MKPFSLTPATIFANPKSPCVTRAYLAGQSYTGAALRNPVVQKKKREKKKM